MKLIYIPGGSSCPVRHKTSCKPSVKLSTNTIQRLQLAITTAKARKNNYKYSAPAGDHVYILLIDKSMAMANAVAVQMKNFLRKHDRNHLGIFILDKKDHKEVPSIVRQEIGFRKRFLTYTV